MGLAPAAAATDRTPEPATDGGEAIATYRLLVLEQVARAARGTPAAAPRDRLERDLYALAEATSVDRELARDFRGIVADLCAARARALHARPSFERLTALERCVECLVRAVLSADLPRRHPGYR